MCVANVEQSGMLLGTGVGGVAHYKIPRLQLNLLRELRLKPPFR